MVMRSIIPVVIAGVCGIIRTSVAKGSFVMSRAIASMDGSMVSSATSGGAAPSGLDSRVAVANAIQRAEPDVILSFSAHACNSQRTMPIVNEDKEALSSKDLDKLFYRHMITETRHHCLQLYDSSHVRSSSATGSDTGTLQTHAVLCGQQVQLKIRCGAISAFVTPATKEKVNRILNNPDKQIDASQFYPEPDGDDSR